MGFSVALVIVYPTLKLERLVFLPSGVVAVNGASHYFSVRAFLIRSLA